MKIKAGELKNMRTRAERARLNILSAKPDVSCKSLNLLHIDEDLQESAADALQEYEDLLNGLIDAAEITF